MANKLQFSLDDSHSTLSLLSGDDDNQPKVSPKKFATSSLNVSLNLVLQSLPTIISLYFLGKYSSVQVQSTFGIIQVFNICLGYGIFEGLAAGLESFLTSMRPELTSVIYQRTLVIATFLMLPIIGVVWASKTFLFPVILPQTAEMAGSMALISLVSIYFNGLYLVSRSYMNSRQSFDKQLKSTLISGGVHVLTCIFFFEYCGFSIFGAVLAKVVTDVFNLNFFLRLININNEIKLQVFQTIKRSQILPLTKRLLERGLVMSLEIVAYETFVFQTLSLSFNEISTHVIATNVHNFGYYIYIGISVVTYINISKYLLNNRRTSVNYLKYGAAFMVIAAITCVSFLLFVNWKSLFTNDEGVMDHIAILTPFLVCYMVLDGIQVFLSSVSRSLGEHHSAFKHFVISFFAVGQPLCYLLRLVQPDQGLKNVWMSMIVSAVLYNVWQGSVLMKIDWKSAARRLQEQMDDEQSSRDSFMEVHYPQFIREHTIKSFHHSRHETQLKRMMSRTYSI